MCACVAWSSAVDLLPDTGYEFWTCSHWILQPEVTYLLCQGDVTDTSREPSLGKRGVQKLLQFVRTLADFCRFLFFVKRFSFFRSSTRSSEDGERCEPSPTPAVVATAAGDTADAGWHDQAKPNRLSCGVVIRHCSHQLLHDLVAGRLLSLPRYVEGPPFYCCCF